MRPGHALPSAARPTAAIASGFNCAYATARSGVSLCPARCVSAYNPSCDARGRYVGVVKVERLVEGLTAVVEDTMPARTAADSASA